MDRREKHTHDDMSGSSSSTGSSSSIYCSLRDIARFVSSSSPLYSLLCRQSSLLVFLICLRYYFSPRPGGENKRASGQRKQERKKNKNMMGNRNIQHESWKKETESGGWLAGWLAHALSIIQQDRMVRSDCETRPLFFPSFLYRYTLGVIRGPVDRRGPEDRDYTTKDPPIERTLLIYFLPLFFSFFFYSANFLVFLFRVGVDLQYYT